VQSLASETAKVQPTPQEIFRQATAAEDAACVIQVDDAHPSNGTNTAILLNGKPLELLQEYNKTAIEAFFCSLANRHKVRIYVSDLAEYLLELGHKYFLMALIVADPFHVVKELLMCFDSFLEPFEARMLAEYTSAINAGCLARPVRTKRSKRKQTGKKTEDKIKAPTFAEIRILLRTKSGELNPVQAETVKFLTTGFREVVAGYVYVQGVMALYHKEMAPAKASEALDGLEADLLKAGLPPQLLECFLKFRNLCQRCRDEICAFWACGWANAEVEAQNSVIKNIDRQGHGLTFEELRRRWLYGKSSSELLGRAQVEEGDLGPPKKEIRELHKLPPPEPVPGVGPGGEGWLFGPHSVKNEDPDA
jgi:hypothetical protein